MVKTMSKLEQLIKELCPDGVEWKTLGEASIIYGGLTGKSKVDFEKGDAKYISYRNIFSNIEVNFEILENVENYESKWKDENSNGSGSDVFRLWFS